MESTDYASSANTFGLLYQLCTAVFGHINPRVLSELNEILRKCGHFSGYAILSWFVFLALKRTQRDRLRPYLPRRWGSLFRDIWRSDWALIAVLFTLIAASLDEIHQTFIPSRTGRWQDIAIDTAGAVLMQLLLYAWATHTISVNRQHSTEESAVSLTR
jgi:VanZ family protein